jgi:hypothetical protein
MFPALAVIRPAPTSFGSADLAALYAPRSLKEPIGWMFSSFR